MRKLIAASLFLALATFLAVAADPAASSGHYELIYRSNVIPNIRPAIDARTEAET